MNDYRRDFRDAQREFYWSAPRILVGLVVAALALGVVGFTLNGLGLVSFSFFAPRYEAVRRDVMIESRAYSEATTREMYRFKLQYQQAGSDAERSTIRAMALHEAQAFDPKRLPTDLQLFLAQLGE